MNVTNMAISSWTAHTEYFLPELQWHTTRHTEVTMPDWVWGTTMKIKTGEANPDDSHTTKDTTAWVTAVHIETTLDHNTGIDTATTEAAHNDHIQPTEDTATELTMTHHTSYIADHPHITALQVIDPKICSRSHSWPCYQSSRHDSCRSDSYTSRTRRRPHPKKNMKVKIEDLHTNYYSSNDHSSDSEEESDPLN